MAFCFFRVHFQFFTKVGIEEKMQSVTFFWQLEGKLVWLNFQTQFYSDAFGCCDRITFPIYLKDKRSKARKNQEHFYLKDFITVFKLLNVKAD